MFSKISRLALVLVLPLLVSCVSSYVEDDTTICVDTGRVYEAIFEVSSETSEGYGLDGKEGGVVEYMKIRPVGKTEWYYVQMGGIKSFEYVKGHEYVIRMRVTHYDNPPADAASNIYELLEILSDKPVESES